MLRIYTIRKFPTFHVKTSDRLFVRSFGSEIAKVPAVSRGANSFGSHPSDTPGYNPFELQSSTPLPPDTPLRSIRREIEHLLKVSRKDDAALGLFKMLTSSDRAAAYSFALFCLHWNLWFRSENTYFAVAKSVLCLCEF